MAIAETYNDFYIATVYGYDLTTRELDVFIPKLMPNIAEGLAPRELPTNFGNQSITIPYKETIKRASTIKVRAKNVDEPIPDIGSKVMVKFLNGNIHINYWEPFNMNADYQVVSEEMYPKYYTLQVGSKTIDVNKDDVIVINLPEGFTVAKMPTVDPKVQLLQVNVEKQTDTGNTELETNVLAELVNENQTIIGQIKTIASDMAYKKDLNDYIKIQAVDNDRVIIRNQTGDIDGRRFSEYSYASSLMYRSADGYSRVKFPSTLTMSNSDEIIVNVKYLQDYVRMNAITAEAIAKDKVFVREASGNIAGRDFTSYATPYTMMYRNADGYARVKVPPVPKLVDQPEDLIANLGYVDTKVPNAPIQNGTYTLKCVVSNGIPTYQWVKES